LRRRKKKPPFWGKISSISGALQSLSSPFIVLVGEVGGMQNHWRFLAIAGASHAAALIVPFGWEAVRS
jgi:hypothetical protein